MRRLIFTILVIMFVNILTHAQDSPMNYVPIVKFIPDPTCKQGVLEISLFYGENEKINLGAYKKHPILEDHSPLGKVCANVIVANDYYLPENLPIWWIYEIVDMHGISHYEIHIFNMIVFQGNRNFMNTVERPIGIKMLEHRLRY